MQPWVWPKEKFALFIIPLKKSYTLVLLVKLNINKIKFKDVVRVKDVYVKCPGIRRLVRKLYNLKVQW